MLQHLDGIMVQSTLLSSLKGVIHGYSCRRAGDMRRGTEYEKRFTKMIGLHQYPVIPGQIHGSSVAVVHSRPDVAADADGVVSNSLPVAVHTADCVPLLMVDPVAHLFGAIHAGWMGTLGRIADHAVRVMVDQGAEAGHIRASIGPHIGACCYDVDEKRARAFVNQFGNDEKMAYRSGGSWHLDIGWVNYRQLIAAGLHADNIDSPPTCTSCQSNEFFSYRKDFKKTYGNMTAVIGFGNL